MKISNWDRSILFMFIICNREMIEVIITRNNNSEKNTSYTFIFFLLDQNRRLRAKFASMRQDTSEFYVSKLKFRFLTVLKETS